VWVEPRTGIIVKGAENQTQILQTSNGRPVLTGFRGQLVWDDATVRKNAEDASAAARKLQLAQTGLPIAALVLGVALIIVGTVLLARRGSRPADPADEPATEPRPADAL
jgi:hypothetical protein